MASQKQDSVIRTALAIAAVLATHAVSAQTAADWQLLERARTHAPHPTSTAISEEDLKTRLFLFADDSMQGRLLGEPGNVKGTAYIASELKRLGLEAAGENGGYFQLVPVVERSLDEHAPLRVGDLALEPWKDFVARDQGAGARSIDGVPVVFAGVWGDATLMIPRASAEGKVVLLAAKATETGGATPGVPARPQVAAYFANAAAIVVVALDTIPPPLLAQFREPVSGMRDERPVATPQYVYITRRVARAMLGGDLAAAKPGATGVPFTGNIVFAEKPIENPARNVVGILRGSDPVLRNEYVAIGAHNDHIGMISPPIAHDSAYVLNHLFREQGADSDEPKLTEQDYARVNAILAEIRRKTNGASARLDSVSNGADDDGSGTVSVLELAEYFAGQRARPKRSLLFVWHVGEEEGLFGSVYFTDHPTVPRDSIVAQLNIDMIGRGDAGDVTGDTKDGKHIHGNPDYLQLVGSRRNSTELGDLAEKVNREKKHGLAFDYSLDADGHPQNIYCRSDHYSYARYGIPIVFFTTGGHVDYHQVTDEPQYIDYAHMTRVVNYIRDLVIEVANLDHRPLVDKPKPDPNGRCRQ